MSHPGHPGQPHPPQGAPQPPLGVPPVPPQQYGAPGAGQPLPPQPFPGQPFPGQPGQPFPGQPFPPQGGPGPFGPAAPAPKPSRGRKIGGIVAAVAVAGGIAAARLVDFDAPEVGDCIAAEGAASFTTVACDDATAEARIVGVLEDEVSESDFDLNFQALCAAIPTADVALWEQDSVGTEGSVYCGESIA